MDQNWCWTKKYLSKRKTYQNWNLNVINVKKYGIILKAKLKLKQEYEFTLFVCLRWVVTGKMQNGLNGILLNWR